MLTILNESVEPFDVDGSLIIHQEPSTIPPGETIQVYDNVTELFVTVRKNLPMIRLLQEASHRGAYVIVWSAGGHRWADAVVRALNLRSEVSLVLTKPKVYFDDKPVSDWLPYRVFIEPDVIYKQNPTTKEI